LPKFQVSSWNALFAPKDLPSDVTAKLSDALIRALDDVDTRKRLLDIGTSIPPNDDRTPQALEALVESEVARWSSVLKGTEGSAK
jgi:tripartite-type tricarboxylate transporter receptor subunit TctC